MMISFNGANYVAQQINFRMTQGWKQGNDAAELWYRPEETFAERFTSLISKIKALGFAAMDLWTAQLNWSWATETQIRLAAVILEKHDMRVASYAGSFGASSTEFSKAARLITRLGAKILGGNTALLINGRQEIVPILEDTGAVFAFENHPNEKNPEDVLRALEGLDEERVGVCIDTGWFGTNGYDARKALEELFTRTKHIHLKDVTCAGRHDTCAFGKGVVPVRACVDFCRENGYSGWYSIEHEPEDRDPTDEVLRSKNLLEAWLSGS